MKYTALIVTFNRLGKLKKTVEETLKLEFTNIVIVNNGSTDGTQAWLSSIVDTRVIVLTLTENTGGAGGFKTGSQYICEQLASDWVFFYDDDAYPYPDTLKSFSQLDKQGCRVFSGLVKDPQGKPCPMNMPFSRVPTSLGDTVRYLRYPGEFIPAANRSMFVQTYDDFIKAAHYRLIRLTPEEYLFSLKDRVLHELESSNLSSEKLQASIAYQDQVLKAREEEIDELRASVAQKKERIDRLVQRNAYLETEYQKQQEQLTKLQNELNNAAQRYSALISSLSWKVTRPLRLIKALITRKM